MKTKSPIIIKTLLGIFLLALIYCKKDSSSNTPAITPPKISIATVTTTAASAIIATGVTLGGNVSSDGNATVTERGIVYATTQNPTTSNTKVSNGTGIGAFTSNVTGLIAGTNYYVRA